MTRGGNRGCCPLQIRIDNLRVGAFLRSRQIEGFAEQPLVQKPAPSGIGAGRRAPDHGLDRLWSGCLKQGFEDQQVQPSYLRAKVRCPSRLAGGAWRGV